MPNFFTKHIFLYDPQQKNTDHFKILSVKPSKLQKQSVFWPQTSSEANIKAAIEAGRVNLVKKHSQTQRGHFWLLQRPWLQPSAADSDQIIEFWKSLWIWPLRMDFNFFSEFCPYFYAIFHFIYEWRTSLTAIPVY